MNNVYRYTYTQYFFCYSLLPYTSDSGPNNPRRGKAGLNYIDVHLPNVTSVFCFLQAFDFPSKLGILILDSLTRKEGVDDELLNDERLAFNSIDAIVVDCMISDHDAQQ